MFWNQFFKVAVEFFIWHTLQMNIFLTNNALKRCLCHKRLWMLSWLASCIISKCHSKHCCWSWTTYIQEGWWSWLLRITYHFFFRISLKHDKSAFVAYLFCIQIWRKRFLICQAHLCHIWSIIDAQQNFSISKQSQITRILLLLLLLSPFSILFSFLLESIFSRFYFLFIWYFQLIGCFKVRHRSHNLRKLHCSHEKWEPPYWNLMTSISWQRKHCKSNYLSHRCQQQQDYDALQDSCLECSKSPIHFCRLLG